MSLENLGNIYSEKKDFDTAIPFLEQAAAIFREVGDKMSEERSCSTHSSIYTALRQPTQAQAFAQRADLATGPSPWSRLMLLSMMILIMTPVFRVIVILIMFGSLNAPSVPERKGH